jgi:hypothetical protein
MASISHSLMIKYGLPAGPSQAQSDQWVQLVDALVRQGLTAEDAGRRAARQIFSGFETRVYASEADTITSLLGRAKDK